MNASVRDVKRMSLSDNELKQNIDKLNELYIFFYMKSKSYKICEFASFSCSKIK